MTTVLPEFTFLNTHVNQQDWQLKFHEDLGYLISCKTSEEQRDKIKTAASQALPKISIYEDRKEDTISFNRKEIVALLKAKEPLNSTEKVILKRRSGCDFEIDRHPTKEMLERIFNAARHAPSAYNEQPWRFITCTKAAHPESYQKLYDLLPDRTKPWIGTAPVLVIIIAAVKRLEDTPAGTIQVSTKRWAIYDTGAAAVTMMLAATSLGLMAHQVGGFDPEKVASSFEIEKGFKPVAVMSIGYNAEQDFDPKSRKPLSEIVFNGSWGRV